MQLAQQYELKVVNNFDIPPWAFKPDAWNKAFLNGLTTVSKNWGQKRVWEVGVGTGVNLVNLLTLAPDAKWYFSDYDARCTQLALRNIKAAGINISDLNPLLGSWDLLSSPCGRPSPTVDIIFGCIPQVPDECAIVGETDTIAHYYSPTRYQTATLHSYGLGLNETLLKTAKTVLSAGGEVILNLGGRPGLKRLYSMFAAAGYNARVLHQEVVPQHEGTALHPLARQEELGDYDFEFFTSPDASIEINARQAELRRLNKDPVYHKIYVIAGQVCSK